eukprot:PhM_4_TR17011/c0_g1_i3/m.69000
MSPQSYRSSAAADDDHDSFHPCPFCDHRASHSSQKKLGNAIVSAGTKVKFTAKENKMTTAQPTPTDVIHSRPNEHREKKHAANVIPETEMVCPAVAKTFDILWIVPSRRR